MRSLWTHDVRKAKRVQEPLKESTELCEYPPSVMSLYFIAELLLHLLILRKGVLAYDVDNCST